MGQNTEPEQNTPAALDVDLHSIASQAAAENFPVALRILPRHPREQLARVYNYARFVDDVGDEAPGNRLALLERIEQDVKLLYAGTPQLAPVRALDPVVKECNLPMQPLLDLIAANRMDQVRVSYQTFDELLDYCRLSAAPIGAMVLYLAGAATERNLADSDRVCAGLQVLEHCQDVREDAIAGRRYLPATDLPPDVDLRAGETPEAVRTAVRIQVERAEQLIATGRGLVRRLRGWSRIAVAGYLAGGLATADALRAGNYDVLARPIKPGKLRTGYRMLPLLVQR